MKKTTKDPVKEALDEVFGAAEDMMCAGPPWLISVRREYVQCVRKRIERALDETKREMLSGELNALRNALALKSAVLDFDHEEEGEAKVS